MSDVYRVGGADPAPDEDICPRHGLLLDHDHGGADSPGARLTGRRGARASGARALARYRFRLGFWVRVQVHVQVQVQVHVTEGRALDLVLSPSLSKVLGNIISKPEHEL